MSLSVCGFKFAFASEVDKETKNIGYSLTDCSAYYLIVSESYKEKGDVKAEKLFSYRQSISISRAIDYIDPKEFEERSAIAMQYMMDLYLNEGVSKLTMQYGKHCDNLIKNNSHNIQNTIAVKLPSQTFHIKI
jgi:hypothetical protein